MARTLPTSMVGIFNDLAAIRGEARNARKQFAVVSVTKNGQPRKVMASDMTLNATETLAQAQERLATMHQLNPGKTFTIVTL